MGIGWPIMRLSGAWRSLVAHLYGVQGVAGSNPVAPMIATKCSYGDRSGPRRSISLRTPGSFSAAGGSDGSDERSRGHRRGG